MLNGLNVADPASATMEILFIPLVVVFAVLAGIFGFLFMRIRGKVGYFQLVVEDQIKDLEGLTMRAAKIDRSMSANLESVKDRLKRLVGMYTHENLPKQRTINRTRLSRNQHC